MEKVLILMGLPASGKTTFADSYYKTHDRNCFYQKRYIVSNVNLDKFFENNRYSKYSKEEIAEEIVDKEVRDCDELILDGLFLNIDNFLPTLNELYKYHKFKVIEIHFWEENRDACLWNDQYRREKDSDITIKNAKLEKPDIDIIKNKFENVKVKIVNHDVEKKPSWKVFADKYNLGVNEYGQITGDSWCLGGTWNNCWGR